MKSSVYNVFVRNEDHGCIVYNTLNGSVITTAAPMAERLRKGSLEEVGHETLRRLGDLGIVVGDYVDERKIAEYRYVNRQFRSSLARFAVLTTFDCNLSCPYCYQSPLTSRPSMTPATASAVVEFIRATACERRSLRIVVGFYGGEPLLNADCCFRISEDLTAWSERVGIRFDAILTTNGTLLSGDVLDRIGPLYSVHLTLDGPRDLHDDKRRLAAGPGPHGTYDTVISAVELLRSRGIRMAIRLNVAKDSMPVLPRLLEDLRDRGILNCRDIRVYTQVISPPCSPSGSVSQDLQCISDDELDAVSDSLWRLSLEWGLERLPGSPGSCPFVNDWTYTIDSKGDVYKCPLWAGFRDHCVGSVGPGGDARWNSLYYDQMGFNPCRNVQCRGCVYLPVCGGGCPADRGNERRSGRSEPVTSDPPLHESASKASCDLMERKQRLLQRYLERVLEVNRYEVI